MSKFNTILTIRNNKWKEVWIWFDKSHHKQAQNFTQKYASSLIQSQQVLSDYTWFLDRINYKYEAGKFKVLF